MLAPQHNADATASNQAGSLHNYRLAFALICSLFFLWGLANSLNGSLIKQFQTALNLTRGQVGFVDSAFYLGYFVFAIPAGLFIQRFGYKKAILTGLLLYALGALLFYPASDIRAFGFFLFALFVIASGLAFLETAANLYVTVSGDAKKADWRINFAQSFNGMSIILGPVIGSLFIFSTTNYTRDELSAMTFEQSEPIRIAEAMATRGPYLAIAGLVLFITLLFWLTRIPEPEQKEDRSAPVSIIGLLSRHRQLLLGVLAQFANVGAQVTLWSYFVDLKMGFSNATHVGFIEYIYPFEGKNLKQIAGFHASFAMILFMLGRFLGTFLMSRMDARRVLLVYTALAVALVGVAFSVGGFVGILCIMGTYFCQSIMFPTIFALATKGLTPNENKMASSLVIMSIVGAAIIPPLSGWLSHISIQYLLVLPFFCFSYIVWFVVQTRRG